MSRGMWRIVRCVKELRWKLPSQGVCYSPCQFLLSLGLILVWILYSLPKSHGFEVIIVVVDGLTKYVHFMPLSHLYTAVKVVVVLMKEIFCSMACLSPLWVIEKLCLLLSFDRSSSDFKVATWPCLKPIILRQMVRLRWLIGA